MEQQEKGKRYSYLGTAREKEDVPRNSKKREGVAWNFAKEQEVPWKCEGGRRSD